MMRITFVAPFGLGQKTTVWARILPLARYLSKQGGAISVLIPPWDTPADAGRRWQDHGVEVINVRLGGGVPGVVLRLLRTLTILQPDLVHIVKPRAYSGLVQWWLWQKRKIANGKGAGEHRPNGGIDALPFTHQRHVYPRILLDIDDWEQAWAPINQYAWPVTRFLAWQEEWGVRHADGITAASRWLVQQAQTYTLGAFRPHMFRRRNEQRIAGPARKPPIPVLYLPNGIETTIATGSACSAQHTATDAPRILFFTRFVEVLPEWLAACWAALHDQLPAARLIVAGTPLQPERDKLFKMHFQRLQPEAAAQVEWLGYIPPAQLAAFYETIHCAIFPALMTPLLQAKCSVKLANTLLHGIPVVASAVGEQANYGADGAAVLVDPMASPVQFANAVAALIHSPALQQATVAQARRRLTTEYPWEKLGEKLAMFYNEFGVRL
jgi:glycosyltransferase involved in cell wall biosynthesis